MTTQEWDEVEKELNSIYSRVKLKCDQFEISIMLTRVNQFKNALLVYVNGQIKGEWMLKECEESRRFFRKVTKSNLSPKKKKEYLKLPRKLQMELGLDKTFSYYTAEWKSFKALKKQLIAQNESIELISKS